MNTHKPDPLAWFTGNGSNRKKDKETMTRATNLPKSKAGKSVTPADERDRAAKVEKVARAARDEKARAGSKAMLKQITSDDGVTGATARKTAQRAKDSDRVRNPGTVKVVAEEAKRKAEILGR